MFNKILFLKRKNDFFSKKIISELKKKSRSLRVITTDGRNIKINLNTKFDFIFSFRSHYILKKKLLNNVNYGAINFHPGPPEYRGIGCVNYALYDNSENYGVTAHLIDEKIDHGKIINIKKFKIKKFRKNKLRCCNYGGWYGCKIKTIYRNITKTIITH